MKIDQYTKISQLINANPAVIEAIASINRHFEKLRNPILRKILASRVTIADAAKIGGTTVQQFYEKLGPLGFHYDDSEACDSLPSTAVPDFYKELLPENTEELDVRNDIAQGKDPFKKIIDVLRKMPEANTLKLINSFEPLPLINLLRKKGYVSHVIHQAPSLVYTFLKRLSDKEDFTDPLCSEISSEETEQLVESFAKKIHFVDVRDLEMPMPMITILNALQTMSDDHLMHVLHRRIPIHLLPELESKGYTYKFRKISEEKTVILIYK